MRVWWKLRAAPLSLQQKICLILAMTAWLSGCAEHNELEDLQAYVAEVNAAPQMPVEPVPDFSSYEEFRYNVNGLRGPFTPQLTWRQAVLPVKRTMKSTLKDFGQDQQSGGLSVSDMTGALVLEEAGGLSLNFQDVDVLSVLRLIADTINLNLVVSDTVTGRITLRLQDIPRDQALELILKSKGLDKRQIGNVLVVAPVEEIAHREQQALQSSLNAAELAPLRTEFIQINYAKAVDIAALMSTESGLLSARGSVSVDERTNTLLVQDTAATMDAVRGALSYLDIPVRQVQVEARIVVASTDFDKSLGIRWGLAAQGSSGDTADTLSAMVGDIAVDLGVASATSALQIGFLRGSDTLDLTLSALESDGLSELVSQPRLVTADGQMARIESGVEIPYQESSSSGATTVTFKDAVLSLEVTPRIIPDNRIILDLKVNKDSVGEIFLGVPSVDTREIQTQVLVENGETIVLGGVYETETIKSVAKTPFLGDIPYLGGFFKRTIHADEKTELLVFITPTLIETFAHNK